MGPQPRQRNQDRDKHQPDDHRVADPRQKMPERLWGGPAVLRWFLLRLDIQNTERLFYSCLRRSIASGYPNRKRTHSPCSGA